MKSRTSVGMRKKERKSGSPIVGLPLQSVDKAQLKLDFFDRLKFDCNLQTNFSIHRYNDNGLICGENCTDL